MTVCSELHWPRVITVVCANFGTNTMCSDVHSSEISVLYKAIFSVFVCV